MTNEMSLRSQGQLLSLKLSGNKTGGGKKRGITHFSKSSRKCLLRGFAKLDYSGKAIFLTLTYGQNFPSPLEAKVHLDTFLKRVHRAFPSASGHWRMEFQQRGAPHFHIIFYNLPFWDKRKIREAWKQIAGDYYCDTSYRKPHRVGVEKRRQHFKIRVLPTTRGIMLYRRPVRPPFTRIEMLHGKRHAWAYISKYVAKLPAFDGGFNNVSFLTDEGNYAHPQTGEVQPIGRYWGVFNRAQLPLAAVLDVLNEWSQNTGTRDAYFQFRRAVRRKFARAGDSGGFFLFTVDGGKWLRYYLSLIDHYANLTSHSPMCDTGKIPSKMGDFVPETR